MACDNLIVYLAKETRKKCQLEMLQFCVKFLVESKGSPLSNRGFFALRTTNRTFI